MHSAPLDTNPALLSRPRTFTDVPVAPRPSAPWLVAVALLGALASGLPASPHAQCTEQTFQNYTGGGQVACPCFAVGEQAGAVFTLPADVYPVEIMKVGIAWGSQFGASGQTLEEAIHVYAAGLPDPGAPIYTLPGPLLTDGSINEFNLAAYPGGNRRIESGPFTVTLEFQNPNAGNAFAGTVVHDGNGCQSGKNVVFAVPGGWFNACALGVTGDWIFYVKYRSVGVSAQASPAQTVFSGVPAYTTSCDTVYVVNNGCAPLTIESISGCGSTPFSIDTTLTAHSVPAGGSTPILVCVTPQSAADASCAITVTSNADAGPTVFDIQLDTVTPVGTVPVRDGFDIVGVVPNPFNPSTNVRFVIPEAVPVTAEVWAVDGSRVRTLVADRVYGAGEHDLHWDGRNRDGGRVASGVYLVRVSTPLGNRVARMVLVQ